jgi:glutaredoxin 3
MEKVRLYTTSSCPYCKELKDLYDKEGIEYENVDINLDENKEECAKVFKVTNVDSVPIVKVGNQLLAPDVSFTSIEEAFDITKMLLKRGVNPIG